LSGTSFQNEVEWLDMAVLLLQENNWRLKMSGVLFQERKTNKKLTLKRTVT
jgi:hypothetical protein